MPWARAALLMATAAALLSVARAPHALERLNPWLSACDLHSGTEDLRGACLANVDVTLPHHHTTTAMATTERCPPPCHHDNHNNTTQCLYYLHEAHKAAVCDAPSGELLGALRLRHCCEHAVAQALRPADRRQLLQGGAPCHRLLDALLAVDALAERISCEFTEVLTRYDCAQPYSIVYHCDDCKEAYRRWVCSNLVPHLTAAGGRVRPCRAVCQAVEQRCPYLLPGDRAPAHPTQYAGEPTFLCLDPNIPETGAQRQRSMHGDDSCCYTYCGGPGRPPCVSCARGAPNATWAPAACGAPGARATPPCRPIASAAAPLLGGALLLVLAPLWSLLTCCVCECACARTTRPHRWTS